ncbi:rab-GTPase-TBC domain-containing protein [Zychaea mexicana]|uniref:rab-GTPase-TBC domain-containing protein n=1 Tax=Zychaea mexicana TaxID=64656 RepID=UPI0022FDCD28|nr:rab-GTPase-TBC domain-containing protein [Zychaea mexicana]KAI9493461.1 rab-GTPase-TBC domain-containing protein [Zychaea mexicana]
MDIKMTRHTSTNLEDIGKKIAQILRDPGDAFDQASVDIDAMTLSELKAFAEQGGLGACVSKADVLADTPDDLMYLSGERIVVLKHIKNDLYLGYCEGVVGQFNAESVHFVELDPRVLESLDAELDFATDGEGGGPHPDFHRYSNSSSNESPNRHYSYSSTSEQLSIHDPSHKWPGRSSLESLVTNSSTPSMPNMRQNRVVEDPYYGGSSKKGLLVSPTPPPPPPLLNSEEGTENFDTSAFNDDYSDDSDIEASIPQMQFTTQQTVSPTGMEPGTTLFKSTTIRAVRPAGRRPVPDKDHSISADDEEQHDGDDEGDKPMPPPKDLSISRENDSMPVDEYGFLIQPEHARLNGKTSLQRTDSSTKSIKAYREQENKWIHTLGKMDPATVKKDAKFKKMARSGMPASVRARVWQFLAGGDSYKKSGMYQNLCNKPRIKIFDVIERDIPRCYPDHSQFSDETGQGQRDLGDILKAYSHYNTQLEYCQGMGRLAGCMLMHMPAEDAFWLLVATIDRYMNGYFTPSLSQIRIDAYIIGELLKDHQPKLAQHLENNDIQPIMYIAQWFMTAFTLTLPWSSVLRVWDVFYFEGVKVFYRISLAILELVKDHLLTACPTNSEILTFLLHIPHEYLAPDQLLEVAFRIKLSKTDIRRYAKKASSSTTDAMGLPLEHGLKNLMAGNPTSTSFKGLGGKIIK